MFPTSVYIAHLKDANFYNILYPTSRKKKKPINTLLGGERRTVKKGAAVQMFLFNSCTIVHKRAHPGHVDLSH